MHHTLTIVSAKYYSAAHCKNSWNFKPNAACPPSSGSSGPNQRVKVTRTDVKLTASSFTNHDTWLMQCGTCMPALELHCTATMEEKKKNRRARHVNMSLSLGSGMGEGGEGTLLVCATWGRGRECLYWQVCSPPGSMVTLHWISPIWIQLLHSINLIQ